MAKSVLVWASRDVVAHAAFFDNLNALEKL
jgi:hypothetical protein